MIFDVVLLSVELSPLFELLVVVVVDFRLARLNSNDEDSVVSLDGPIDAVVASSIDKVNPLVILLNTRSASEFVNSSPVAGVAIVVSEIGNELFTDSLLSLRS